jgi:signal transduction histidine kinase
MDTSDAAARNAPLSEPAASFLALRDAVLGHWAARVAQEVPAAARLGQPILADTLPILFENIAAALEAGAPRSIPDPGALAGADGRGRASVSAYGPHELVHELQIFREVLFAVAGARRLLLDKQDAEIIGHSIEEAMRDAIRGYHAVDKEANHAFIATLSHDLRNPLHVASASAQLIQRKTSDESITTLAKRIHAKLAETDAMIQTLLDARSSAR